MGYDRKVYEQADEVMQQRRNKAIKDADIAKQEFFIRYPKAEELERKLSSTLSQLTKILVRGDIELKKALEQLKKENLATQAKLKKLYKMAGIEEEELEPKFHCEKCQDKGNIDGKMCDCYKALLREIACSNLNKLSPFKLSTFNTFSLDYYSDRKKFKDDISEREKMGIILKYSKSYAKNFSLNSPNILMRGNTGLGKTHLSLAIAREVIEKRFGVVYCSTPEIVSKIEKEHFGKTSDNSDSESTLKECDLLILDDLGSEFHTSFTQNIIYNIINYRLSHKRPTIISTNLNLEELEKNYSSRLVSRIMGEDYIVMNFVGTDIRQQKKTVRYNQG